MARIAIVVCLVAAASALNPGPPVRRPTRDDDFSFEVFDAEDLYIRNLQLQTLGLLAGGSTTSTRTGSFGGSFGGSPAGGFQTGSFVGQGGSPAVQTFQESRPVTFQTGAPSGGFSGRTSSVPSRNRFNTFQTGGRVHSTGQFSTGGHRGSSFSSGGRFTGSTGFQGNRGSFPSGQIHSSGGSRFQSGTGGSQGGRGSFPSGQFQSSGGSRFQSGTGGSQGGRGSFPSGQFQSSGGSRFQSGRGGSQGGRGSFSSGGFTTGGNTFSGGRGSSGSYHKNRQF